MCWPWGWSVLVTRRCQRSFWGVLKRKGGGGCGGNMEKKEGHLFLCHCPALVATQESWGEEPECSLAEPVKSHGHETRGLTENPMKTNRVTEPRGISPQGRKKGLIKCLGAGAGQRDLSVAQTVPWARGTLLRSPGIHPTVSHGLGKAGYVNVGAELEPAELPPRKGSVLGTLSTCFSTVFLGFFVGGFFVFGLFCVLALAKRGCCWI